MASLGCWRLSICPPPPEPLSPHLPCSVLWETCIKCINNNKFHIYKKMHQQSPLPLSLDFVSGRHQLKIWGWQNSEVGSFPEGVSMSWLCLSTRSHRPCHWPQLSVGWWFLPFSSRPGPNKLPMLVDLGHLSDLCWPSEGDQYRFRVEGTEPGTEDLGLPSRGFCSSRIGSLSFLWLAFCPLQEDLPRLLALTSFALICVCVSLVL